MSFGRTKTSICTACIGLVLLGGLIPAARAQSVTTAFLLHGEPAELSGTTNGSVVTPAVGPVGNLVNTGGSVNFAPAAVGNGVYFVNCCNLRPNAYYRFTGTQLASIVSAKGEVDFTLISRQSWAQRRTNSDYRSVFDVEDTTGHKVLRFFVDNNSGTGIRLFYAVPGTAQSYYVPSGQEDAIFGLGKALAVKITWDGINMRLYQNGSLVQTTPYTPVTPSWSSQSVFTLGGANYYTYGAANACDDIIDEFTVLTSASTADTTAPSVPTGLTATAVSISQINLSWTASTDDVGVTGYKIFRNGAQVNTSVNTSFSDTGLASGTSYTYTVSAYDGAGNNSSQSTSALATTLAVTVGPVVSITIPVGGTSVAGTINVLATATDAVGVAGVQFQLDGVNLGAEDTTSPYFVSWNTTTATNGPHTLTAVARNTAALKRRRPT